MIKRACGTLRLSRAMVFRLLARYKEDQRASSLLTQTSGRKPGTSVLNKEQERIITAQIRDFYLTRERRPVAALHREQIAQRADFASRLTDPCCGIRRLSIHAR
jgi:hypothetical protein